MSDDLRPLLERMDEPSPPASLAAGVMARIEREGAPARVRVATSAGGAERAVWIWALTGLALVIAAWSSLPSPSSLMPSAGLGGGRFLPAVGAGLVPLVIGLLLFLKGLFAPLRPGSRRT
jgi:hypothetical protein